MKEVSVSYAAYNYWANQELFKKILSLPAEKHSAEAASSFSSIHATIVHMWDAESIWWQRMKLQENITVPSLTFHPSPTEAANGLLEQSREWAEWAKNASLPQLEHEFTYQNTKKEKFRQPVWQVLLHLVNHGSYHRGQLVTMMRMLGEQQIPQTDYIHYTRSRK